VLPFTDPYVFSNVLHLPPLKIFSVLETSLLWGIRLLVLSGFYVLVRRGTQREWLFVLSLAFVPLIALTLPDLILGGGRSSCTRYLFPSYLGFQLAVAYLLGRQLFDAIPSAHWQQKFWRVAAVGAFTVGFGCCVLIVQANLWWTKTIICNTVQEFAEVVNKAENPFIISDADAVELISLSYYLNPKVPLIARPLCRLCHIHSEFLDEPFLPDIPKGYTNVFLFKVSATDEWQQRLKQQPPAYSYVIPNKFCPRKFERTKTS
jgi:hypothetical protein